MTSPMMRQSSIRGANRQDAVRRRVGTPPEMHLGEVTVPAMAKGSDSGLRFDPAKPVTGNFAEAWKEAGVALALQVDERDYKGKHARSKEVFDVVSEVKGRLKEGALIALYHGDEPSPSNQHLRVIQSVTSGISRMGGAEFERAKLGPPVLPKDLPGALKKLSKLTSLHVNEVEGHFQVMASDQRVVALVKQAERGYERNRQLQDLDLAIFQAATEGRRDGGMGKATEHKIIAAAVEDRLVWKLLNGAGYLVDSADRSAMDRRPPASLQDMLGIVKAAYEEAREAAPPRMIPPPVVVKKPIIEIDADFVPSEASALRM